MLIYHIFYYQFDTILTGDYYICFRQVRSYAFGHAPTTHICGTASAGYTSFTVGRLPQLVAKRAGVQRYIVGIAFDVRYRFGEQKDFHHCSVADYLRQSSYPHESRRHGVSRFRRPRLQ